MTKVVLTDARVLMDRNRHVVCVIHRGRTRTHYIARKGSRLVITSLFSTVFDGVYTIQAMRGGEPLTPREFAMAYVTTPTKIPTAMTPAVAEVIRSLAAS